LPARAALPAPQVIETVYQLSMAEGNTDGDNLELTDTQGFCCRATFSGGRTVTGTFYVGDLDIRANTLVAASSTLPAPSATSAPAAAQVAGSYSPSAVTGGAAGGAVIGAVLGVAAYSVLVYRTTGALPAALRSLAGWGSGRPADAATSLMAVSPSRRT